MTPNRAWKLACELRRQYDQPGQAVPAIRRALLILGDEPAEQALARAEQDGHLGPLWAAVKRHQRSQAPRAPRPSAVHPPAGLMSHRAAHELAREWGPVLGLSWAQIVQLRRLAQQLGEDRVRDALADALEGGAPDALAALERAA